MAGKRQDKVKDGFSWCSRGKHLAALFEFYPRRDGTPRPWCISCTKEYSQGRETLRAILKKRKAISYVEDMGVDELPDEELPKPKAKVVPFRELPLDWLTPIWGMRVRSPAESDFPSEGSEPSAGP